MREAGRIVAAVKVKLAEATEPGVTTAELDNVAEMEIRRLGAVPSFKGLYGFPATICASFNEEIVHGIPSSRALQSGDILSLDVGAVVEGFHSDSAFSVGVGEITEGQSRKQGRRHICGSPRICGATWRRNRSAVCRPWNRSGFTRGPSSTQRRRSRARFSTT